jgi:hypothetical protein
MQIRVGCELIYECPQPTPTILMLNIHFSRASDLVVPDRLVTVPSLPIGAYRDSFGTGAAASSRRPERRGSPPMP